MPNNYDFSKLENVKEVKINPEGWVKPITIQYGTGRYGNSPSYFWRVKGAKHTFVIPVIRIDYLTEGNYAKHFEEALWGFREDYKSWAAQSWQAPWMREYRDQFSKYIII